MMNLNKYQKLLISLISAIFTSLFVEIYIIAVENCFDIRNLTGLFSFKKFILIFIVMFIFFRIVYDKKLRNKVFEFIYKYRYYLSVLVIAICVFFQIHGSSINELNIFGIDHNVLIGISRSIRSDEYNVNTLMAFSQYYNNFGYFSSIFRATPTDMFIVYGQAVLDIAVIFRPFNIGYLFLNQGMGLSFFWISRLVVLLLVSFEMGMLITNKNRLLSLTYAILITLSPFVQWWFAINGLVEQLIFGQLGVLLINLYMKTKDYRKRIISALLMIICIGGFLITFYPSWQIPFAYVFILLAIWIILKNKNEFEYGKKDFLIILSSLIIFSIITAHILNNSYETIKIVMNTAYPGGEIFNGSGEWHNLLNYIASVFFPLTNINIPVNTVENSVFIDFFPVPIILFLIVTFVQKTKDKLLWGLFGLYLLFMVFYFIILPDSIVSITLRNHIKTTRLLNVITFISVLILIRSLASLKEIKNKKIIIIFSIILSAIVVYLSTFYYSDYYLTWMIISLVILYAIAFSSIFLAHSKKGKIAFLVCVIFISFTAGALVNPVDQGCDVIFENEYIHEVESIVQENPDANWIVQVGMFIDYLTPVGAHTINSVHTYPDLDRWHIIDTNNESEDVYNRYSNIVVDFKKDGNTTFELIRPDVFHIILNVNDLEKLNVSYIATNNNLEDLNNEHVTFVRIYEYAEYRIYHVEYH